MSDELSTGSPATGFVVACRGRASAIFRPDEALAVTYKDQSGQSRRMQFGTRYRNLGFNTPVPEDLWVHTEGSAPSIEAAVRIAAVGSQEILVAIGLAANAWMGKVEPEVAFDSTKGKTTRDFWQAFVPELPIAVVPGRFVEIRSSMGLLKALQDSPYKDALLRAAGQYCAALERWTLGAEVLVVAHLFMAAEAIKGAALRKHLADLNLSEGELATRWGYKQSDGSKIKLFLESNSRRRLVFEGDDACHRSAKAISDSFEHGFSYNGKNLTDDADAIAEAVAAHVRKCLLSVTGMAAPEQDALLAAPYDRPLGPLRHWNIFRGTLQGEGESYAHPGAAYPIMIWKHRLAAVVRDAEGKYGYRPEEKLTAHLGPGFKIGAMRYEVWGRGRYQAADGKPPELVVEVDKSPQAAISLQPWPVRLMKRISERWRGKCPMPRNSC